MSQSTGLAMRQVSIELWQMVQAIAPSARASRFFDGVTADSQAAVIMLKGAELGLPLMAAFEFIQITRGRPTLSPRGALALIYQSGELAKLIITESEPPGLWCTVYMRRRNGVEYTCRWTMADAIRADLVTQTGSRRADGSTRDAGNWEKYPSNMLRWRAVGFCADIVFPDVQGGLKRADEFGATIDEAGDVIDVPGSIAEAPTAPEAESTADVSLTDLVEGYGADAVLAANAGRIPSSTEELATIARTLAGQHAG